MKPFLHTSIHPLVHLLISTVPTGVQHTKQSAAKCCGFEPALNWSSLMPRYPWYHPAILHVGSSSYQFSIHLAYLHQMIISHSHPKIHVNKFSFFSTMNYARFLFCCHSFPHQILPHNLKCPSITFYLRSQDPFLVLFSASHAYSATLHT